MISKIKLGVNIDHVATIRNARGNIHPEPIKAALIAQSAGADNITAHLREDRRHISDIDIKKLMQKLKIPLNLEMAPTKEMLDIAIKLNLTRICLVPEKRKEITTEGGLKLYKNNPKLRKIIHSLRRKGIRTSLFIEPTIQNVEKTKEFGADCVELHTGKFCNLLNLNKNFSKEFIKIQKSANYATKIGLDVHAGHGLTYRSAKIISKIKNIKELNIGHFIVSEAIFVGLKQAILNFKKVLK